MVLILRLHANFANQLWVCADGAVYKYKGDVQAYKVGVLSHAQ